MKQLLSILIVMLFITSCKKRYPKNDVRTITDIEMERSFETVRIGECQYILRGGNTNAGMTHKGDCDNPFHLEVRERRIKHHKEIEAIKKYHKERQKRRVKNRKLEERKESNYENLEYNSYE